MPFRVISLAYTRTQSGVTMAHLNDNSGLKRYLTSIHQFAPLARADELSLARRYQRRHDTHAAEVLVHAHLRFVVKIANSYRGYGLRIEDLIEEGNIGLLEAVRRFDPDRGLRFMTYAAYWIRATILAHVLRQWSMVSMGTGPMQSRLFFRLARERAKLVTALGSDAEESKVTELLATKFGTNVERIRRMTGRLDGKDSSLDAAAFREGDVTGIDLLTDEAVEDQEARTGRLERDRRVRVGLGAVEPDLDERERYILAHRLLSDEPDTLAQIGRKLRLSRERVRQLEERLKIKLRGALSELAQAA